MVNKIILGDCIKEMKRLKENSVDLIVTDPPYNVGVNYGKNKDRFSQEDYTKWCVKWIKQCERILKRNGSLYIINKQENNARIMCGVNRQTKLFFKRWIIWFYPSNIGCSPKNFTPATRSILFYTKGNRYQFNLKKGQVVEDVVEFNLVKNVSKEKVLGFPNQIPEKLISLLVELSTNKHDVVLDPFLGSGTTGVVCKKLNRNFIGIEIEEKFIEISKNRIDNSPKV